VRRAAALLAVATTAAALSAPPAAHGAGVHVRDRLVFTHQDGTRASFPREVRVWCGPWEPDVRVRSIHVLVGRGPASWLMTAVLADVRRDPVVRFPNDFVFDAPRGALLFVAAGGNEASSAEEEASGTLHFRRARCGAHPRVAFTVDATLGSEFSDGGTVRVRGSFRATL